MKFSTADGGTVEVTRVGISFDIHVRDAAGRTVATVDMSSDDAFALMQELDSLNP
ncbi:hypothetical protein GCM10010289_82200 [Streptomyces violascens]|uniref:Uncharacterized protein n=1 Tax=Streptomyces violascens TaxID=67381 RepID=A0ABQ3QQU0_9ACTN|nr:hypothetical protein GCM10010289_82200 [Streptomyces violascens]GHI39646.1 hypothetical protein Sviol_40540 [Streptomyces violascens]